MTDLVMTGSTFNSMIDEVEAVKTNAETRFVDLAVSKFMEAVNAQLTKIKNGDEVPHRKYPYHIYANFTFEHGYYNNDPRILYLDSRTENLVEPIMSRHDFVLTEFRLAYNGDAPDKKAGYQVSGSFRPMTADEIEERDNPNALLDAEDELDKGWLERVLDWASSLRKK